MHRASAVVAVVVSALVLSTMTACNQSGDDNGPECFVDSDCGGDLVCARPGECLPQSRVRDVTLLWTINGAAAGAQSCVPIPNLMVRFDGLDVDDELSFLPVPCAQGQFHVDKLPTRFLFAQVGIENRGYVNASRIDDDTRMVQFDLMPDLMP